MSRRVMNAALGRGAPGRVPVAGCRSNWTATRDGGSPVGRRRGGDFAHDSGSVVAARLREIRPAASDAAEDVGRRAPGFVLHRMAALPRCDLISIDGIRCTSATRTIIDCAVLLDDEALEAAFEQVRRMGLTSPAALARRAGELCGRGRPGSSRVRRLLAVQAAGERALESRLEVKLARLLRNSSLSAPVATASGRAVPARLRVACRCVSRASATGSSITVPDWRGSGIAGGSPRSRPPGGASCT